MTRGMLMLAEQFIGPVPVPFRATLFDKNPAANWLVVWHQDTALPLEKRVDGREWGPWSNKDGILYAPRSVVGSRAGDCAAHFPRRLNGVQRSVEGVTEYACGRAYWTRDKLAVLWGTITPVECAVSAGGVVGMRPLIVHGSSKATDDHPRRVLHIEYSRIADARPRHRIGHCPTGGR
jgi:hypothetical protein